MSGRLVPSPVFILCTPRSGSTLLRVLLDTHSMVRAPHELFLTTLGVEVGVAAAHALGEDVGLARAMRVPARPARRAMSELGLDREELTFLLWDRVLHRELVESGKSTIVEKTPDNVFALAAIRRCWPSARFVVLLRHPAAVAASLAAASDALDDAQATALTLRYAAALDEGRNGLAAHTVRYEELVASPAEVTRRLCSYLGLPWEAAMLAYGAVERGPFRQVLGDWSENINSGRIQPATPAPADTRFPALLPLAARWGYPPAVSG